MKKLFTLMAATLLAAGVYAQDDSHKLVDMTGYQLYANDYDSETRTYIPRKLDEPVLSDYNRYYYNALNQNSVETTSYAHYRYLYNANGTVSAREQWSNSNGNFYRSNVAAYEYDGSKNMTKMTSTNYNAQGEATSTSGSLYEDYVNGYYQVMKNVDIDGNVTYETHYEYTFNEANQILSSVQLTGADFTSKNIGVFYTYEGGKLVKEVQAYYNANAEEGHEWDNVTNTTNYTYNTDGTINTRTVVSDTRYGHSEIEWRYTYADLDPALIPQNVTCDGTIGNNEVYVKWDAVAGATGYMVMYDNAVADVNTTEFITPLLNDGEHQIAVLAIVNGEKKNLSDFVKVSVKDEGNLPMENFRVVAAEKVDVDNNGYVSSYYNLTLEWDVPAGASPITNYKVYVDKGESWNPSASYIQGMPEAELKDSYNDVTSWVTDRQNFYWTTFENTQYDPDTYQTVSLGSGPDCKIWICAIYATGESQPSNVVDVNIYNLANGIEPEVEESHRLVDMTGYQLYANDYDSETRTYIPRKLDEPVLSDYNRYYYNALNQNSVETTSYAHYRYLYNANGTVSAREQWSNSNGNFYRSNVAAYEYDGSKNMTKMTSTNYNAQGEATSTSGSLYEDYVNGYYQVMKNVDIDGNVTYETHYEYTFNEANQILSSVQLTGADFTSKNIGVFYTYEGGKLVKEVQAYYNANAEEGHEWDNVTNTTNYTYNTDGTINTRTVVSDTRYGHSEIEWRYTYADLDPALIPQNVTCDGTIGNNEVYVKWDAVAGATGYMVMYDNAVADVNTTEFITPLLNDGEHQIAVLAIVNGEKKNLSDFVKVSVKDEGNLPMENFRVVAAEKVDVDNNGYVSSYYNLTLEWDVPAGASPITNYKVYVDKGESWNPSASYIQGMPEAELKDSYNDVTSWVTDRQNFYWTTFEDTEYDPDTWQTVSLGKGPDCKIWICAVYATGESQPSNVVEVNIYNLANGIDGIEDIISGNKNTRTEYFNLKGQRVGADGNRQLLIIRQGNQVKKVLK